MNSHVNYGDFPNFVKAMEAALQRWSADQFEIDTLFTEEPLFGQDFAPHPDVTRSFWNSDLCQKHLTMTTFKAICSKSLDALQRQLTDFLPGGVYGGDVPEHVQRLLKTCPLTNLTGERLFDDLDYSMVKRKTAPTFLHSTISMWKHNRTSTFLSSKSPKARRKLIDSAKKNGKKLKQKHKAKVKETREAVKRKIEQIEHDKAEKELKDKDRQAALLTDLLDQGGLCHSKEDLDSLMAGRQSLQKLKVEMRFRKYYMNATDLRLTGKLSVLYANLCSHMGFDYDTEITQPPRKKSKTLVSEDSTFEEDEIDEENDEMDEEDDETDEEVYVEEDKKEELEEGERPDH